jgi:calcium-dependent protein kinase
LKTLDKAKLKEKALEKLREEIRIMAKLDHPNIIRLHEVFEDTKKIHLVVELCTGGELLDRLHKQQGHHYNEKIACTYIKQMLSAVNYCHENNIAHRDLKLENFLFENELADGQLKLIDFGLSQHFDKNQLINNPVGTPYYVAPEVLNGAYDNRCDIWSLGVIAFMLLSGTPPFYGKNDVETLRAVKIGKVTFDAKLFNGVSSAAKDFITNCLTKNVAKRPNAKTLLQHEWFRILQDSEGGPMTPSLNVLMRLRHFEKRSGLTKICMGVLAHTLSTDQITNLRKQFQLLDKDNTGEISIKDLKHILEKQGSISAANMEHMFDDVDDVLSQHKVKYHEFLAATLSRQNITENNMKVAFEKLSNHGDTITFEHLRDLLGKEATDKEIEDMMIEANVNPHSNGISYSSVSIA